MRMIKPNILLASVILLLAGCSSSKQYSYVNTATGKKIQPTQSVVRHQPVKPSYPRYIVTKGDTLSSISRRSGLSVFNIKRFNQLKSEHLEVGQVLYLPGVYKMAADPGAPKTYNQASAPTIAWPSKVPSGSVKIIPRSQWSRFKMKGNVTPMGAVKKITVHHTDDGPSLHKTTDIKFLNSMENHHRNIRKWACIGYHYIIGRDGKIYEGRPVKYQGAHARSSNPNNIGISLIGDFNKGMPSKSQISSLEKLLAKLRNQYKVPANRVYGHTHLGQTQCPGKYLKNWLEVYRTRR